MTPFTVNSMFTSAGTGPAAAALRSVQSQSSIARLFLVLVLLVIAIPLAIVMLFAAMIAGVFILGLIGVNRALRRLKGLLPRTDGRENVRVIRRVE
jgi:hypothetical protein